MKKNMILQADTGSQQEYNKYYMRVSSLYRGGKWMLLLLFTIYLIVMLLSYRDSITYENFLYLTRNLQMPALREGSFSSVVYEEQQNMSFAAFKGELVVAGASKISFYDGEGTLLLQDSSDCGRPVLIAGDKYLMMYDEGGTSYSLYTSIGRVYRSNAENIIQCAAINDQGFHAVAAHSQESKYCITLYDASFRKIAQYYRDTYVTGLALQSGGEQLAILSITADGSSLRGTVTVGRVGSDSTMDISLGDRIPLSASYMENGTLVVVTDGSVLLIRDDAGIKTAVSLSSMLLSCMSLSDTRLAVVCRENTLGTSNRLFIIDETGCITEERTISGKVVSVTATEGETAAYIRGEQEIIAISSSGGTLAEISYTGSFMDLCVIDGRAVFCFATGAQTPQTEN